MFILDSSILSCKFIYDKVFGAHYEHFKTIIEQPNLHASAQEICIKGDPIGRRPNFDFQSSFDVVTEKKRGRRGWAVIQVDNLVFSAELTHLGRLQISSLRDFRCAVYRNSLCSKPCQIFSDDRPQFKLINESVHYRPVDMTDMLDESVQS